MIPKRHDKLVGIDSDGCVFDSMRAKTFGHILPQVVSVWRLEPVARTVMEVGGRICLRSRSRGRNRFLNLLELFRRLAGIDEVRNAVSLPDTSSLAAYCGSGAPLGNPSLEEAARASGDRELFRVLEWSNAVNAGIGGMPRSPAFAEAVATLPALAAACDTLVVSQTPAETIEREWLAAGIRGHVAAIAGQEFGSKTAQLLSAGSGRYPPGAVMMIGDAPGDMEAADEAGALFYPIIPGREEESWHSLRTRDRDLFLAGRLDPSPLRAGFLAALE